MGLIFNIYFFLNKVVVSPVNSAQCLLHSVIHVHEQCGLLFISLNALFMGAKKKKKKRQTQGEKTQIQTLIKRLTKGDTAHIEVIV